MQYNFKNHLVCLKEITANEMYQDVTYEYLRYIRSSKKKAIQSLTEQSLCVFKAKAPYFEDHTKNVKICESVIVSTLYQVFAGLNIVQNFKILEPVILRFDQDVEDSGDDEFTFDSDDFYDDVETWIQLILEANWDLIVNVMEETVYSSLIDIISKNKLNKQLTENKNS